MAWEKEICKSFRSHCRCRQMLLFVHALIILFSLLGACYWGRDISYDNKSYFFLSAGLSVGVVLGAFEAAYCRKCVFFREKIAVYAARGYLLFVRIQYGFFRRLMPT